MSDILIVTAHTGYNYGTYLQAFAMKKLMNEFADNADIIWQKSFGPTGRDYRIKKVLTIGCRTLANYKELSAIHQGYAKNFQAEPNKNAKEMFDKFSLDYLAIKEYSSKELKKLANNTNTIAVVCGSDQIWNASSMYPDPLYYLQFVPPKKRIAYAPSFGREGVPNYNKKLISNYLKSIPNISAREESGAKIIYEIIGRKVPVMPDPTLVVDWEDWMKMEKENYIVVYFLDEPNDIVLKNIKSVSKYYKCDIKVVLHDFNSYKKFEEYDVIDAGPKEFVKLIAGSRFVCTDSYHASIFSILSDTPFFVFERNYGAVSKQSSRLESLLTRYGLNNCFIKNTENRVDLEKYKFSIQKDQIEEDKKIAREYIDKSIKTIISGV